MTLRAQHRSQAGIALIIVMMMIVVFATLAGGFAYSMKVETKLARNTGWESDMEWLGRSGVELGKYVLAQQLASPPPDAMYSALNQVWAGGPGNPTNEVLMDIRLKDVELGPGKFSVSIVDQERKFNLSAVNQANPAVMERALMLIGVESGDVQTIIDSYLDWIDPDHKNRPNGAESLDYLTMTTPYYAKNGPVDDIRELLLLKGMTEQVFWGRGRIESAMGGGRPQPTSPYLQSIGFGQLGSVGLVDLFTTIAGAGPGVNVNTASEQVLQLVPGIDQSLASAIVAARNGPDGAPGTEDDTPFINTGELINVPGMDQTIVGALARYLVVQSQVFEITVDAEVAGYKRRFVALVHRRSRQQVDTLYFTWK